MHSITTRPPNPEEQRLIASRTKPDFASWGCLVIFFGIVPTFVLGFLGGWLGGFVSDDVARYAQWTGWGLAAALFLSAVATFIPYDRRARRRAAQDDRERIVQDLHVTGARAVEIGLISDNEPILAFDLGEGKILLLQGQWLRDAGTYGAEVPEGDPVEEFVNRLPAPYSFPSTEFTLSRFPHSGEVLNIRVAGPYAAPGAVVEALKPEYDFRDSEILEGSLEDIAGVLAREHERRSAR